MLVMKLWSVINHAQDKRRLSHAGTFRTFLNRQYHWLQCSLSLVLLLLSLAVMATVIILPFCYLIVLFLYLTVNSSFKRDNFINDKLLLSS